MFTSQTGHISCYIIFFLHKIQKWKSKFSFSSTNYRSFFWVNNWSCLAVTYKLNDLERIKWDLTEGSRPENAQREVWNIRLVHTCQTWLPAKFTGAMFCKLAAGCRPAGKFGEVAEKWIMRYETVQQLARVASVNVVPIKPNQDVNDLHWSANHAS